MNHVFEIPKAFPVPDGTLLSPFLNPKDSESPLSFNLLDGFSLAAGEIEPGLRSKIQIFPFVTQVTFVRKGTLQIWMKGEEDEEPYSLELGTDQAAITPPNTFLQLVNRDEHETCETLYIVSPAYLFLYDKANKRPVYDDSVIVGDDWQQLRQADWHHSTEVPSEDERQEAYRQLAESKNLVPV